MTAKKKTKTAAKPRPPRPPRSVWLVLDPMNKLVAAALTERTATALAQDGDGDTACGPYLLVERVRHT